MKTPIVRLSFMAITFLLLSFNCFSATAEQSSMDTVQNEARSGGYQLLDLDGVWQLYQTGNDKLLLVDTRQEWEYHSGYINGAVNFPMEPTWLARMTQRGALEQFIGPDKSKTLVFY